MGKSTINGPFSLVMLVYQRVIRFALINPFWGTVPPMTMETPHILHISNREMTKDHKLPRFTPTIPTAGVAHGTRATLTAKKSNMTGISMETHDSSVTP